MTMRPGEQISLANSSPGRLGVSVEIDDWPTYENYVLLLKKVFGYKTKVEMMRPKCGTTDYWKWYYHNYRKTNGEVMERRAEYTRKWRTKQKSV